MPQGARVVVHEALPWGSPHDTPVSERKGACYRPRRRMDPAKLRELLDKVRGGNTAVDDAIAELRQLPFADLGYATGAHHPALRQGAPEVICGDGKTAAQIAGIAKELARTGQNVLVT